MLLNKYKTKREEGFTIIEVLIVLAIAGLIILIVFLAVPALQRNSRNTQRKNDVQGILGSINEYAANHNGANVANLTDATEGVKTSFYQTADIDPVFGGANANTAISTIDNSKMYLRVGAKCNAALNNVGGTGASSRSVAIVYTVEKSGGVVTLCQEG